MNKLAGLILLLASVPCFGSIVYVQSAITRKSNAGNPAVSFSATPTVGNLVVAAVACYSASNCNVTSVTDNQANTYTVIAKNVAYFSTQATVSLYYTVVTASSGTFTVTANLTASSDSTLAVAEYSGVAQSSPVDISTTATGSSTAATATMTTTNANDLLIQVVGIGGSGAAPTAGSGFTMRQSSSGSLSESIGLQDQVVTTAGSKTASMTTPDSGWATVFVAFKQAAAASVVIGRAWIE